jgi:CheY-like chemotaxis protein
MKHEILLVDAERRTLRVLDVALRGAGYSVQVARDGVEALERARDTPPDVIVTDSGRPGFDAYGMIERLKERLETSVVPVVLLASRVTAEDELRARSLGVAHTLSKPVFVQELIACLGLLVVRTTQARLAGGAASRRGRIEGSTKDTPVVDLLQSFETTRESGVVRLVSGTQQAEIRFRDGRVVNARAGGVRGEPAVHVALEWSDAVYELEFRTVADEDVVDRSTGTLLIEGMQRVDEWALLRERLLPLAAPAELKGPVLEEALRRLLEGKRQRPDRTDRGEDPEEGETTRSAVASGARASASSRLATPMETPRPPAAELPPAAPATSASLARTAPTNLAVVPLVRATGPAPHAEVAPASDAGPRARAASSTPSSPPWTREAEPPYAPPEDEDVAAAGVPRLAARRARRIVMASVAVAAALCVAGGVRSMSLRRDRAAEEVRSSHLAAAAAAPPRLPLDLALIPAPVVAASSAAPSASAGAPEAPSEIPVPEVPSPLAADTATQAAAAVPAPPQGERPIDSPIAPAGGQPLVAAAERALLQGKTEQALKLANQAVVATPSDANAWLTLAAAHRASGDIGGARYDYRQCVAQARTEGVTHCRILAAEY